MEPTNPVPTSTNDMETAMRLLKRHREQMMKSYQKNKEKRLAYAKSYYQRKKEEKKKEEDIKE